ncbi:hypothetical protein N007_05840 [Alicyclobacillus acidoterrestris ATCC 49025]|nr:hypothetical protein N007_05840 [Alicyclobacillus acidoterrestris ATCC 49025]
MDKVGAKTPFVAAVTFRNLHKRNNLHQFAVRKICRAGKHIA